MAKPSHWATSARLCLKRGGWKEAIDACRAAVAIYQKISDLYEQGKALISLGLALEETVGPEEAITAYEDALAIYQETGDPHEERIALQHLQGVQDRKQS